MPDNQRGVERAWGQTYSSKLAWLPRGMLTSILCLQEPVVLDEQTMVQSLVTAELIFIYWPF